MAKTPQQRQREAILAAQRTAAAQRLRNQNATLAAGHSPFQPFHPYQAPNVPAGYYDPVLDSQRQAASRGLDYTEQDTGTAGRRAQEDYATGTADIARQRGYEGVDYQHNVDMLNRSFQQLGRQQAERARQYGVVSGGLSLLSAAKRQENQGLQQGVLDTAHTRALSGFDLAQTGLETSYNRGVADRGTSLGRARSEDTFYGTDVNAQKLYQAQQAGYEAPVRGEPGGIRRNEHIIASGPSAGLHTRTQRIGAYVYTYDQAGRIVSKRRA